MAKLNWVNYNPLMHAHLDAWRFANPNIAKFALSSDISAFIEKHKTDFLDSKVKVAYDGENTVGFIGTGFCKEPFDGKHASLCLPLVVINPALSRQGYGRKMLNEVISNAEEIVGGEVESISLSTHAENSAMNNLMQKLPFQKINLGKVSVYFMRCKGVEKL